MTAAPEHGDTPQAGKRIERSDSGTQKSGGSQPPAYIEVDGVVYPLTIRCGHTEPVKTIIEKMVKNASDALANQPDWSYNKAALIGLDQREEDENGFNP